MQTPQPAAASLPSELRTIAEGVALSVAGLKLPDWGGPLAGALLLCAGLWVTARVWQRSRRRARTATLQAAAVSGLWIAGAVALAAGL